MEYSVEMGSTAMINISSFIKSGSGIQKMIGKGFHSMMFAKAYYCMSYPKRTEGRC
jgi:hypothetical protein